MGIREYGYIIGEGSTGKNNLITDVPGVRVGHSTVEVGESRTGVTVIIPCEGLVFKRKPVAAAYALNGYGKTMGIVQVEELGTLETPIALTNTLNVGKVADALVEYTLRQCRQEGTEPVSINPLVGETNDSRVNRIADRAVETRHVLEAIGNADSCFAQGDVGAGKGTVCFGLKGGIGSSSRKLAFGGREYVIGALVQSNFGRMKDLMLCGRQIGKEISEKLRAGEEADKGSIMVVVGTDIPLDARQLKRVLKRAAVGLIRTGSYMGHGSGDVFLGFTNGNFMPECDSEELLSLSCFPENQMDRIFRPAAEAVEEAILNSLVYAGQVRGRKGELYHSLREFL